MAAADEKKGQADDEIVAIEAVTQSCSATLTCNAFVSDGY